MYWDSELLQVSVIFYTGKTIISDFQLCFWDFSLPHTANFYCLSGQTGFTSRHVFNSSICISFCARYTTHIAFLPFCFLKTALSWWLVIPCELNRHWTISKLVVVLTVFSWRNKLKWFWRNRSAAVCFKKRSTMDLWSCFQLCTTCWFTCACVKVSYVTCRGACQVVYIVSLQYVWYPQFWCSFTTQNV